jgi:hypothetical protein
MTRRALYFCILPHQGRPPLSPLSIASYLVFAFPLKYSPAACIGLSMLGLNKSRLDFRAGLGTLFAFDEP